MQRLVDRALDAAQAAYPGIEFGITMSATNTLLLPKHDDRVWRTVEGRVGYYKGHVYRDCLVDGFETGADDALNFLIIVSPVDGLELANVDTYFIDLRSEELSTALPPDVAG